jgi:hypothetical protein
VDKFKERFLGVVAQMREMKIANAIEVNVEQYAPPTVSEIILKITVHPKTGAVLVYSPRTTDPVRFDGPEQQKSVPLLGSKSYYQLVQGATECQIAYVGWIDERVWTRPDRSGESGVSNKREMIAAVIRRPFPLAASLFVFWSRETGRRKHKKFQWFTNNVGYPKLREHLGSVVAIMKLSADWYDFRAKLDRLHPRYGKPTQLSLELSDDDEPDTGKGL